MMETGSRIYVAGDDTLIGAAILRALRERGGYRISNDSSREPDLRNPLEMEDFFSRESPEYVFFAAGRSGGIRANEAYPAELILDNLLSGCHVLQAAWRQGVRKLLYLASSCAYPRLCLQPMKPESLMTGPLEQTNEAYATAKLAGIALCRAYRRQYGSNFITVIPANVFGPGDDFSPEESHVIAALMRRMHEAKVSGALSVEIWGTGTPIRDFLFADDLSEACLFLMDRYNSESPMNVGTGTGVAIREIAETIRGVVGYPGKIFFEPGKPDGMPIKVLDTAPLRALGWLPRTDLREALSRTYDGYLRSLRQPGITT